MMEWGLVTRVVAMMEFRSERGKGVFVGWRIWHGVKLGSYINGQHRGKGDDDKLGSSLRRI